MSKAPQLADAMGCFCKQHTHGGFYFWKAFMTDWKSLDPKKEDEFNYCFWWIGVKIF